MIIQFYKYHGTGNDFIIIDNRPGKIKLSTAQIAGLCNRRLGIGADGLMLLGNEPGYSFNMEYYNSNGYESSMCGNGGRCMTAFAHFLGIIKDAALFVAIDGIHKSTIHPTGIVDLHMKNVTAIKDNGDHFILDTGSPHYVTWVNDLHNFDLFTEGKRIRYNPEFQDNGINVNFVQKIDDYLFVRTYERGVEDETLSCGTGVTAAAIAAAGNSTGRFNTKVKTPGGELSVSFTKLGSNAATDIILTGPAVFVFKGEIEVYTSRGEV